MVWVAAYAPFNFPLLLMAWKVAPALMAGNTVVCKTAASESVEATCFWQKRTAIYHQELST